MEDSDKSVYNIRHDFEKSSLNENEAEQFPALQFEKWMNDAINSTIPEVMAMTLSTVNKEGKPSGRILYLREYGNDNYAFFTNYQSRKANDLIHNPNACLTFFGEKWNDKSELKVQLNFTQKKQAITIFIPARIIQKLAHGLLHKVVF